MIAFLLRAFRVPHRRQVIVLLGLADDPVIAAGDRLLVAEAGRKA